MSKLPQAFSPEVLAELARPVMSFDPRAAQLGDISPKWYVVEIVSRDIEAELIKLRFGIYVPREKEIAIVRGRRRERLTRMFPGYVFVFLWESDHNYNLLIGTPGVVAVLGALGDAEVDRIRYIENCARPVLLQSFTIEQDVIPKKRKRFRKLKKRMIVVQDEVLATRPWSAFEDAITTLDSGGRISALRNLLGVCS